LRGTLKLMGCKSAESQKISGRYPFFPSLLPCYYSYLSYLISSDRVFRAFEKDYLAKQGITRSSPTVASRRHSGTLGRKISSPSLGSTSLATSFSSPGPSHPTTLHVSFTSPMSSPNANANNASPYLAPHPVDPIAVTIKRSEFFTVMRYALHVYVKFFFFSFFSFLFFFLFFSPLFSLFFLSLSSSF